MSTYLIKTNRIFTPLRKWAWIFILVVAFGGLWYPKLGLLMVPLMLTLPILGFAKGKYWCGNICPHGSFFDRFILPFSANRKIPGWARSKITMAIAFSWFIYILTSRLIKVFGIWGSVSFIDRLGYVFVMNYFMVTVIGTTLAFLISPRTWCNFCPMATFQMIFYKLGKWLGANRKTDRKISISHKQKCHSCGKCARVCPLQLTPYLEFSGKNQFDHAACIRCSTCVENCPAGILSLNTEAEVDLIKKNVATKGYEKRRTIAARVHSIKDLGSDVREYGFKFEQPSVVNYQSGQFILIKIQDQPKMFRAYSIASFDKEGTGLSITVKKVPQGYGTEIIFESLKVNDLVELEGPMGHELVVDKEAEKVLLVAGGIGITPFVSIVQDMRENDYSAQEVKLIYGVNYESEFLYHEYFSQMASENKGFEFVKVAALDESWKGKKGFVTDVIKELDLKGYKVYMCGPKPMISAVLKVLNEAGVKKEDIFYESA